MCDIYIFFFFDIWYNRQNVYTLMYFFSLLLNNHVWHIKIARPAMSHIAQFEDVTKSPAGDVDVSAGDAHL